MTDSFVLYNGTGAQVDFTIPFDYLDADHVLVEVAGASVPFTFFSATVARCTTAPGVGTGNVKVRRATPTDPLVSFTDGAGLTAADLNLLATQYNYVTQEVADAFEGSLLSALTVATANLQDLAVSAAKLGTDAVTTSKILNLAVTAAKLAADAVTTSKILDANVTNAKLANMATQTIKGRTTAGTGVPEDLTAAQATALLNAVVGDAGAGGTKGLVPAPAAGDAAALKFLKADGTFAAPSGNSGYILLQDQKAANTAGGSSVATTWTKRDMNTEVADTANLASIASNVISLAAGTYKVKATSTFYAVGKAKIRLRNTTDNVTLAVGASGESAVGVGAAISIPMDGRFTIAGTKNVELQYYCVSVQATDGLGRATNAAEVEVYSSVELIRE